jgi:putative transposase
VARGRDAAGGGRCAAREGPQRGEGCDGNKKVKGRKRHVVVDALGLLVVVAVTAANLDDGAHACKALARLGLARLPRLKRLYADNKYNNHALRGWMRDNKAPYEREVKSKPEGEKEFKPLKIRWVVEQAHACLGRCRRLSKDCERTTASSETWVQLAAVRRMLRRIKPDTDNPQPELKYRPSDANA